MTIRPGCLADLPSLEPVSRARHVLIVTDPGLAQTGLPSRIQDAVASPQCRATLFDAVEPNPEAGTVDQIGALAREDGVDLVIGLGGGSALDAGKAGAMLARNPGSCVDYEGRERYGTTPAPFIAIPTTCGTGSEVTWVSVVTRADERRKISIKGNTMFPTAALVDADVLRTLPSTLVAYTGMDALTHAVEAYVGNQSNPASDALAEKAIALLMEHLPAAVGDIRADPAVREAVMRASTLAGMAFGNADVGAVHCLSETLGGLFGVPHGLGNAILLAPVMRSHQDSAHQRLADLATIVGVAGAEEFVDALEQLARRVDIPPYSSLGIDPSASETIAEGAVANGSNGSNPRTMDARSYLEILGELD